ncbi:type II secretion system F family protein [Jiella sp. M17.18]|uniref:type II secretion system F family protein n=1 Tax=Jiella sp. M17.18 TaxID=3234247 RepID=UPI0034DF50D2
MPMLSFLPDSEMLTAALAGVSASLAIVTVAWPYLAPDRLAERMRQVDTEREEIRTRERAQLSNRREGLLREPPKRLYQIIVDRLNLSSKVEDGEMAKMLRMAGYRGRGPMIRFLAARVIASGAFAVLALSYAILVLAFTVPTALAAALAAAVLGYQAPRIYIKNRIGKRQTSIRRAWPEALDLMLICVEAGMNVEGAFRKVSEEIGLQSVELAEELNLTTAELSYLQDRRSALENLGQRTGLEGVRAVMTALIQAERYGTPVGQALRVLAQENRDMRMAEAEKKAAALPPKLTVPMIVFFLPVLFAIILTPSIIRIMGAK